jgi:hypothetical protein
MLSLDPSQKYTLEVPQHHTSSLEGNMFSTMSSKPPVDDKLKQQLAHLGNQFKSVLEGYKKRELDLMKKIDDLEAQLKLQNS